MIVNFGMVVYLDTVRKTAFLLRETVYSWYNRACALCKPMWMQLRTQARSLSSQPITVIEVDFLLNEYFFGEILTVVITRCSLNSRT